LAVDVLAFAFFWFIFAVIVGIAASARRSRDGLAWFLLALIISPLLAGLLVLALPDLAEQRAREDSRACPFCAEAVKQEAVVCKHCGRDLPAPAPIVRESWFAPNVGLRIATAVAVLMILGFFGLIVSALRSTP